MTRGDSLTQCAYEHVRADLLACRIMPGTRISIVDLAAEIEVSAGAIREALARLTAEGLVVADPQRGFRAADVSASDLADLTHVRAHIEELCIRNAIANGDVAWESHLVATHHALSRAPALEPRDEARAGDAWSDAHGAFHEALVSACDNRYLLEIRRMLYARSERYRRLSVPLDTTRRDVGREHRKILEAALARDADRVAALMTAHLEKTTTILTHALFKAEPKVAPEPRPKPARRRINAA